ncbi:ATP-binding protein [Streptomyces turgidiscabies]|uniref:Serine/threonine-protein kinase RsbW n=1 Tax=Streptomyces turgidiscabies TaxID=85558 RepID=A0ABU0RR64_9ACTN|nr:ATP-binding protein [Streptomyces turgidiscabies]MDQ0934233.1 serine/threonine-protein kinase RsbW [Streptomyces turgidiscabies]
MTEGRPSYTDTPEVQMIVSAQPRPTGRPGYSETLPCLEESAEVARKLVRTALAAWQLEELADAGALLVSELVANAVKHTNSRLIRVVVSRPSERFVRIGVVDKSRTMPEIEKSHGDELSLGGRGLVLMDAVTERWGTDLYRWGKQVWGELRV